MRKIEMRAEIGNDWSARRKLVVEHKRYYEANTVYTLVAMVVTCLVYIAMMTGYILDFVNAYASIV